VITIFSAPNYCDFYNNKGAIMLVDEKNLEIRQIEGSAHPFYLPNNVNIF
jgi:serine/threonine-protein phosphatase 2B catalytic subunit